MLDPTLMERVIQVADALEDAGIPYAFGGAIALTYWAEPRATYDIDVNIFVPETQAGPVLEVLIAAGVPIDTSVELTTIRNQGQTRIHWDVIPLDLFFLTVALQESAHRRAQRVDFGSRMINVLSAEDLALCKIFFSREKDWIDLRGLLLMQGRSFDLAYTRLWLADGLEADDTRISRFERLVAALKLD